ncbi:MAG: hypothetical protein KJ077_21215 [Anaerolineae bacterium]|nr:hypothetical protein [Anaerolineae bacterium]
MIDEHDDEEEVGQNRLFVTLAIALIGLLVLGLLGVGAVFIIRQNMDQQTIAAQPSPTLLIRLPNPTATFTPIPKIPTNTPMPTPTNTPVVAPGGASGQEAAVGNKQQENPAPKPSPTRTPAAVAAAPAGTAVVPETGFGGLEAVFIAVGLAAVLFIARRLRMSM